MKHIVIAANPYRDSGLQKALTVYRMLTEHGHQVVVSPVFVHKSYLPEDIPVQPLEQAAQDEGKSLSDMTLKQMETYWARAKRHEKEAKEE